MFKEKKSYISYMFHVWNIYPHFTTNFSHSCRCHIPGASGNVSGQIEEIQMSNDQNPGYLLHIGDEILSKYMGIKKNYCKDPC